MSYVPEPDAGLLARTETVVVGQITAVASASAADALDASRYQLRVEEVLKGEVVAAEIEIEVPGALDPLREGALIVPGAPRFALTERLLLFLDRRDSARYTVTELALGAFHIRKTTGGEEVLARDLAEVQVLSAKSAGAAEHEPSGQMRKLQSFRTWLRTAETSGLAAEGDYWVTADEAVTPKFSTLETPPARWFEFDEGRSVSLYAASIGQTGLPGGGYAELQQAIAAWNGDPGSNLRYRYGGLTGVGGSLAHGDGINQVTFNDPANQIAGSFNCTRGSLAAYSGYRAGAPRSYRSRWYRPILEMDVVVQDGAGCMLATRGGSSAAELLAHELGHTLGLGHACGENGLPSCVTGSVLDEALMRPVVHVDGRGAALGADDRAAAAFLYPSFDVEAQSAPAPANSPGKGGGGATGIATIALLLLAWFGLGRRTQAIHVLAAWCYRPRISQMPSITICGCVFIR